MKLLKNLAMGITLLTLVGSAVAGGSSTASAAQALDMSVTSSGDCKACLKINRYAVKSTLLVRQLLAQNGVALPQQAR
ncbi:MAG: hypothetical protein V4713_04895 [Pseudomonadota bacterium]